MEPESSHVMLAGCYAGLVLRGACGGSVGRRHLLWMHIELFERLVAVELTATEN